MNRRKEGRKERKTAIRAQSIPDEFRKYVSKKEVERREGTYDTPEQDLHKHMHAMMNPFSRCHPTRSLAVL
jgi:hypothetical protein